LYVSQKRSANTINRGKRISRNQKKNTIERRSENTCGKTSGKDYETHENKKINSSSSDNTHEAPSPKLLSLSNNKTLGPLNENPNSDHR
jgi:hypothetical protein